MKREKQSTSSLVRKIKRKTRGLFLAKEKIKIVLKEPGGEESISDLCQK